MSTTWRLYCNDPPPMRGCVWSKPVKWMTCASTKASRTRPALSGKCRKVHGDVLICIVCAQAGRERRDRQTDTDRQTDRQTDIQTDRGRIKDREKRGRDVCFTRSSCGPFACAVQITLIRNQSSFIFSMSLSFIQCLTKRSWSLVPYCVVMYCVVMYCMVLYHIVLHGVVSYCNEM